MFEDVQPLGQPTRWLSTDKIDVSATVQTELLNLSC
jgi:hypothetical protein